MKKEIKICLPFYKIIYSFLFVLLLSIVRGISTVFEIGVVLESAVAFLTIVFCADTYLVELHEKRREVFLLYPKKIKIQVILRRLLLQMTYMLGMGIAGYGFFSMKRPLLSGEISSFYLFGMFLLSIIGTIFFWGTLSVTLTNLAQNLWVGIGISVIIWLMLNSVTGEQLLGKWNVFAFAFRNHIDGWEWMYGKILSIILGGAMILFVPLILKKRG